MNNRKKGTAYEEWAAAWLTRKGMEILKRNYRCRQGEIDLIARDGKYLVFIEVKYRGVGKAGHPAEAVDRRKQARIIRAARQYLFENRISEDQACRFDVVSILGEEPEHIEHAFECS
ncbi:MAG: YraN family protein [Clostridiales bacterium]|nr:YraN family protein [Clostridiales bacterium]